jgi:hypothetical protein
MIRSLHICMSILCMSAAQFSSAQCLSTITIQLKNIRGGVYANQSVTLTAQSDGKSYSQKSNSNGIATLSVPCEEVFAIAITNYTRKKEIMSGTQGESITQTFTYEPDMVAKDKMFEMSAAEKAAVDEFAKTIPDTIIAGYRMPKPKITEYYARVSITVVDINNQPLEGEELSIIGEKRHKNVKGTTGMSGQLVVYLPKGDKYFINFKYNRNYISKELEYSKGSSEGEMTFAYLGTKEIEKRKKIEAERIAAEEKKLKVAEEEFEKKCKKLGISAEEGRKREVKEWVAKISDAADAVVSTVLNRNKWAEKLIVCDLTGSMSPYAAQLAAWYQLSYLNEKNLQFVFFNDGDNKPDGLKTIGSTGGIYYAASKGVDSLFNTIARVAARGDGGDCPENNMEALIKGLKLAKPYKELVMIADNNAPVKDISLLKNFSSPVHIILCGVDDEIMPDYLNIARKTKGSIHTMEEDLTRLAAMSEGQEIKIGRNIYRIMGGEFIKVSKA